MSELPVLCLPFVDSAPASGVSCLRRPGRVIIDVLGQAYVWPTHGRGLFPRHFSLQDAS